MPDTPDALPVSPPEAAVAVAIFVTFRREFESLEKLLLAARLHRARERRKEDRNVIFKDISKPRAMPIQSLVEHSASQVIDISADGHTVTCDKAWPNPDQPLFGPNGTLDFIHREAATLHFSKATQLEVGDTVRQEVFIGDVHHVFRAFTKYWESMWMRHEDAPIETWEPFYDRLVAEVAPAPGTMPYEPITVEQWMEAVKQKRVHTASGPDGVSRLDLLSMPLPLVQQLVDLVNQCETSNWDWPQVLLQGHVSSLEKHAQAMGPSDYRPITILSVIWRVYASIRSKQMLRWLDGFADPTIVGNRPHRTTKHIWWSLAEDIEFCHHFNMDLSGIDRKSVV